jgi:hypothetical protein
MKKSAQAGRSARGLSIARVLLGGLIACTTLMVPARAATEHTVYHSPALSFAPALVVRWDASAMRASLVDEVGAGQGSFSLVGQRRRLVLDQPLVQVYYEFDSCHQQVPVQYETTVYLIGPVSGDATQGSSTVHSVGQRRVMAGCDAGQLTPYGDENEPGVTLSHRAMSLLPGMADLKKGRAIAGFLDVPARSCYLLPLPQDVARFPNRHRVVFDRSGQSYARSAHPDGWMVLDLPSGPRGFLRVAIEPRTHAETWLVARMTDGQPSCVAQVDMVAADASPSFGGDAAVARNWQLQTLAGSDHQYRLYGDHTGAIYYLSDGFTWPLTWSLDAEVLTMRWSTSTSTSTRTWQPLHRKGRYQWVMDSRISVNRYGNALVSEPSVYLYEDLGPGVPPALRSPVPKRRLTHSDDAPRSPARQHPDHH